MFFVEIKVKQPEFEGESEAWAAWELPVLQARGLELVWVQAWEPALRVQKGLQRRQAAYSALPSDGTTFPEGSFDRSR